VQDLSHKRTGYRALNLKETPAFEWWDESVVIDYKSGLTA